MGVWFFNPNVKELLLMMNLMKVNLSRMSLKSFSEPLLTERGESGRGELLTDGRTGKSTSQARVKTAGVIAVVLLMSGCSSGPKGFTRGEYDDPNRVELLDDKFNEADMQQMAETVIRSVVACRYVARAPKPPVVSVEKVQNRTEEHIDTVALTDMVRTALIKTGKVRFVNNSERGALAEEVRYQNDGNASGPTAKKKGQQIGADYILSGAIATNVQQVGDQKYVYYKLTMNLTNIETSTIDCTEEKQLRKKFQKQSIGF